MLVAVVAAGAFHLAFASPALSFFILVFLFGLVELSKLGTNRRAFYFGVATGLAVYAPQLGFFWTIFGGSALALWCVLAFWVGLFVVLARQCRLRFGKWGTVLLIPVVWTGLEYFRSELYYLRFSWLSVGYALSEHFQPLGRLGVYGVGFSLMLAIGILSVLPRKAALALGGAVVVALAVLCGDSPTWRAQVRQTGSEVRVAGVQMEFPPSAEVPFVLDRLIGRIPAADLIVLSEYTFDGPVPVPVLKWCRKHRRYLIVGGKEMVSTSDFYDTAYVISPAGEVVFRQAKSVPIQFFKDGFPAREQKLWDSPWGRIGLCVCYDLSYRRVADRLIGLGAQGLIVPTMDLVDWGRQQHQLHARIAPVRAAEYGVPIFRVASSGISQLVEAGGAVVATAPFGGEQVMFGGTLPMPKAGALPLDRVLAPVCVWVTAMLIAWFGQRAIQQRFRAGQSLTNASTPNC